MSQNTHVPKIHNSHPTGIIGLSQLISGDDSGSIMQLEKEIITGANSLLEDEANDLEQYKLDMAKLETTYNVGGGADSDDSGIVNGKSNSQWEANVDEEIFDIKDTHLKHLTVEQ